MSVTAKRPVGVGDAGEPTVIANERTTRVPSRSRAVLEERSTWIAYRVHPARSREGSSLTHPNRPFARSGVGTAPHFPRRSKTERTVRDPNWAPQPSLFTTFPPGAVRSAIRSPRRSQTIGWPWRGSRRLGLERASVRAGPAARGPG